MKIQDNTTTVPEGKIKETAHYTRIDSNIKKTFDSKIPFSKYSKKVVTEKLFALYNEFGDSIFTTLNK